MRQQSTIQLLGGGPGSGCNPQVAEPKCGRPKGAKTESNIEELRGYITNYDERGLRRKISKYFREDEGKKALILESIHYTLVGWRQEGHGSISSAIMQCIQKGCNDKTIKTITDILVTSPELNFPVYRGMVLTPSGWNKFAKTYKVGATIDIPPSSFSDNVKIAESFAEDFWKQGYSYSVIFEADKGSTGLDLRKRNKKESEIIVTGRFKITNIRKVGDKTIVRIKQTGRFKRK